MKTIKVGSIVIHRKRMWAGLLCVLVGAVIAGAYLQSLPAFANTISIGGQDNSEQMKDVKNLITTIQNIGFNWVAKVIGGFMVIGGVYKVASRDFLSGILATGGGGTLFFVEKIAESLSRMSGN
jgi:hypothetical protein